MSIFYKFPTVTELCVLNELFSFKSNDRELRTAIC